MSSTPSNWLRLSARLRRRVSLAIALSLVLSVVLAPRLVAATVEQPRPRTHVVSPGDSLWDVARQSMSEEGDPRRFIDAVRDLNDLTSAQIVPGQTLLLPGFE